MRVVRVLLIALLVGIVVLIVYKGWQRNGPNQFEAAFNPGGNVSLDLSAGGYEIRGTTDKQVRVQIDSGDANDVRCRMSVNGSRAKVEIEGPANNNFRATIYVPERTDLNVDQTIGDMEISGVEGNKSLGLGIGRIHVEVPNDSPLPTFDGSVTLGGLRATNWHVEKGGFFRSFYTRSNAPYSITAHVDIGDLETVGTATKVDDSHSQQSHDADEDVTDQDSDNDSE